VGISGCSPSKRHRSAPIDQEMCLCAHGHCLGDCGGKELLVLAISDPELFVRVFLFRFPVKLSYSMLLTSVF